MTSWAPGCRLVASALTLAILLHVTGAGTAAFLPKIRLFSSASGATVPEEYDCKKNKTVLIGDLVKVAQQDKIFLTLEGQSALRFTRNVQAHVTDGSPAKASKPVCFQSCAVVGNGGVLQLSSFGANIDSHTVVFRSNQAPTSGYEPHVGTKTTFRVVNKHWLIKYSTGGPPWIPKEDGMVLVMGRGEPVLMNKTAAYFSNTRGLYTVKMGGQVGSRARTLLQKFRERRKCVDKSSFSGGATPTSGLYQVIMALSLCRNVTVYGFGDGGQGLYQYYKFFSTERQFGTVVHSFSAEKALLQKLHKEGFITVCNSKSKAACGCQAPGGCGAVSPRSSRSPRTPKRSYLPPACDGFEQGGAEPREGGVETERGSVSLNSLLPLLDEQELGQDDVDSILKVVYGEM
eukprot:jgi/Tetstr1/440256/TSEL_028607.t1